LAELVDIVTDVQVLACSGESSRRVVRLWSGPLGQRTGAVAEERRGTGDGDADDDAVARSLSEARVSGAVVVVVTGGASRGVAAPMPLPIKMRAVGAGPAGRCGAARARAWERGASGGSHQPASQPATFWGSGASQIFTATVAAGHLSGAGRRAATHTSVSSTFTVSQSQHCKIRSRLDAKLELPPCRRVRFCQD
jgi:hypothetical protein